MVKKRVDAVLKLESGDYTHDDLVSMDYTALTTVLDEISDTMTNISNQLDASHADYVTEGISADYKWHTKAKSKLRILERFRQKVSRLRKKQKIAYNQSTRTIGDIFIDIAKVELPPEKFDDILDKAKKEREINDKVMKGELYEV